jgi:hypothetical protein
MNVSICVEDIMTPRRLLHQAATDTTASAIAKAGNFDAVPITSRDGKVREYWSRQLERRISIRSRNLIPHDCPILDLLPVVAVHTVQFVHYRLEIVGIVDASDLNKPLARLAYLQHMLELERAILDAVRFRKVSDAEQAVAIGRHAKKAQTRQRTAARGDLLLPLLDYVEFPVLLEASRHLGITKLTTEEVHTLNDVRKRAAHAGDAVVEHRADCQRIIDALGLAVRLRKQVIQIARPRVR